jgi:hypothetical protein
MMKPEEYLMQLRELGKTDQTILSEAEGLIESMPVGHDRGAAGPPRSIP